MKNVTIKDLSISFVFFPLVGVGIGLCCGIILYVIFVYISWFDVKQPKAAIVIFTCAGGFLGIVEGVRYFIFIMKTSGIDNEPFG